MARHERASDTGRGERTGHGRGAAALLATLLVGTAPALAQLSGDYTVGAGGDYATLTAAVAAVVASGISGPTTLVLTDATYAAAETFPINLNQYPNPNGDTLTIRPAAGVEALVSGAPVTDSVLALNGADHVTVDGVASGGSSLTLRCTTGNPTVTVDSDSTHVTIRNTTVEGGSAAQAIFVGGGSSTGNDHLTIADNVLRDRTDAAVTPPTYLVYVAGSPSNGNLVVTGNELRNFTSHGIYVTTATNLDNATISGNTITQDAARGGGALYGMQIYATGTNTIAGNTISNLATSAATSSVYGIRLDSVTSATVAGNRIHGFAVPPGFTGSVHGIQYYGASGLVSPTTVVNNQVTIAPGQSGAYSIRGLDSWGYSGNVVSWHYNTVYVGGAATGGDTYACVQRAASVDTFTDTVCHNARSGGSGAHYAMAKNSSGSFTADHNVYVGTGVSAFPTRFLHNGTTAVDLATWRAGTGQDAASQADTAANVDLAGTLVYASTAAGDLHVDASGPTPLVADAGAPVAGVAVDFDLEARDAATPDVGSDEFEVVVLPTLSVDDPSNPEPADATFTVTLSAPSADTVTVLYATADGTAAAPGDYAAASGTVTFSPGDVSETVPVTVVDDLEVEGDETFHLLLSGPVGATVADGDGLATIVDDDASLSVADGAVLEGDAGPGATLDLVVTLSRPLAGTVSVGWATVAGGTATAGADYASGAGTLTFAPGDTSETASVTVAGDLLDEPDETVLVQLSDPVGATVADGEATGTILDDDPMPNLSAAASVEVCEGQPAAVWVRLDAASGFDVSVDYQTADGSATAGADYTAASGTATVAAGEREERIAVATLADDLTEASETFTVALANPSNAVLLTPAVEVTICDANGFRCIFADGFESGTTSAWSGTTP